MKKVFIFVAHSFMVSDMPKKTFIKRIFLKINKNCQKFEHTIRKLAQKDNTFRIYKQHFYCKSPFVVQKFFKSQPTTILL